MQSLVYVCFNDIAFAEWSSRSATGDCPPSFSKSGFHLTVLTITMRFNWNRSFFSAFWIIFFARISSNLLSHTTLYQANLSLDSCIAQLQRCIAHITWIESGMKALVSVFLCKHGDLTPWNTGLIPAVKASQLNSNRGAVSFMKCLQHGSIHRIYTKRSKKDPAGLIHSVKSRWGPNACAFYTTSEPVADGSSSHPAFCANSKTTPA